ncbi:adenosinetriphosphatase [Diaporthe helianthi]|uniref:Adenosinetriphosphatase n=1 Tax=Diaporthe helianthi TaxID=158607 RepID=A0A2P5HK17_DIAHE|nr:adenosinetriphosphatase [Diaporthe helianthi]
MLRNKATLPALQKTYDESYLTCSTAVYYEGQGNEKEAMRCWKSALSNIYDHNANKVPATYDPRSETERALVESLKKLELQCKERIDLLEALRMSRQEDATSTPRTPSNGKLVEYIGPSDLEPRRSASGKGWIGDGTIPAITYPELSRPALPPRPSLNTRTSSEQAVVGNRRTSAEVGGSSSAPRPSGYHTPSSSRRPSRSPSPEKYTMRTTLRSNKSGERSARSSRRPLPKATDEPGASRAATLAWGVLGTRTKSSLGRDVDANAGQNTSLPPLDGPGFSSRKPDKTSPTRQWDSHSRRLVRHRDEEAGAAGKRRSIELSDTSPFLEDLNPEASALSINAASSALTASGALNGSAGPEHREHERTPRHKLDRTARLQAKLLRGEQDHTPSRSHSKNGSGASVPMRPKTDLAERQRVSSSSLATSAKAPAAIRKSASDSSLEGSDSGFASSRPKRRVSQKEQALAATSRSHSRSNSRSHSGNNSGESGGDDATPEMTWKKRKAEVMKNLPPGVDKNAAKQILNEIVVRGDEVRWSDIAGLEAAKSALREAVVYPFLRPDLFMGLREPARGMLLFGPPGTGKTMLARAVATESRSAFFSISASSLTSKYLGESEKLVRALFGLAKVLAPSIIFVDEIDSLLSQRSGSGEHEATRRIKTEFLIQWSDLQRAAAGRDSGDKERGDANRVLVLAATNLPWAIDEAARRRFVRRQYIPLPESETRAIHLKTLLGQQKHSLTDDDFARLVELTDGYSGSDITALAKDAAMGPLRSLGEALLHMTMEEIRPIALEDFVSSLANIRPSVSKAGLKDHEDWATEFGERGG